MQTTINIEVVNYKGYLIQPLPYHIGYVAYDADNNFAASADGYAQLAEVLDEMIEQGASHQSELVY